MIEHLGRSRLGHYHIRPMERLVLVSKESVMRSRAKYESRKVANIRLTALGCWILEHAEGGLDRGEIVAGFFGLERRYRGYFTDPCFSSKQKNAYELAYRRAQPHITKVLMRLETLGLIHLTRKHSYVKYISLTQKGEEILHLLKTSESTDKQEWYETKPHPLVSCKRQAITNQECPLIQTT